LPVDASAYPHAEIQLTEWSSSPSPVDHTYDSLAAAAFVAKTNLESIGLVDSLSYWVFTDVFEENRKTDSGFSRRLRPGQLSAVIIALQVIQLLERCGSLTREK